MSTMKKDSDINMARLSDRILFALQLALEQEDAQVAKTLTAALEISMTRNTGGNDFVERRDYSKDIEDAMERLSEMRGKKK